MAGSIKEKESVVGNRAQQLRGLLALNYPMGASIGIISHVLMLHHAIMTTWLAGMQQSCNFSLILTLLTAIFSLEHGIVTDWHDMEHIWQSVYKEMEIAPEDVRRAQTIQLRVHLIALLSIAFY